MTRRPVRYYCYVCIMGGVNKRDHLIKTGQELIWSKGYDLCSIKDITTKAGLPKGSFYHYFDSKEKFALEAMEQFIESSNEMLPDHKNNLSTLEKMIDLRIDSILKIQFSKECYMSVMCHAYSEQEDAFRKKIVKSIEDSNESMLSLLTSLKEKKLMRAELSLAELMEFIDFSWRGARLKARITKSDQPLRIFKKYLFEFILKQ